MVILDLYIYTSELLVKREESLLVLEDKLYHPALEITLSMIISCNEPGDFKLNKLNYKNANFQMSTVTQSSCLMISNYRRICLIRNSTILFYNVYHKKWFIQVIIQFGLTWDKRKNKNQKETP